jgi:hypothetical protein
MALTTLPCATALACDWPISIGGKFSNPRILETVRPIGFKFRELTTVAGPFRLAPVRRRSDLWFSSWGSGPQIFDLP